MIAIKESKEKAPSTECWIRSFKVVAYQKGIKVSKVP